MRAKRFHGIRGSYAKEPPEGEAGVLRLWRTWSDGARCLLAEWPCGDLPASVFGGPWLWAEGVFCADTDSVTGPDYLRCVMLRLAPRGAPDPFPVAIVQVVHG